MTGLRLNKRKGSVPRVLLPRVLFLDRDGVINRKPPEGGYVKSWEEFKFLPGVRKALRLLKDRGFQIIVATNQRGVSLGELQEPDLLAIHSRMQAELEKAGARIDAVYYCPHDYDSCKCRKPEIGLFLQAKRDFPRLEFRQSFLAGDSITDMQAAARLGCRKILIAKKNSPLIPRLAEENIKVDHIAPSLRSSVERFLLPA